MLARETAATIGILLCHSQAVSSLTTRWRLSSSQEMPVLAWPIRSKARNQVVSGSLEACVIVPAVSVA